MIASPPQTAAPTWAEIAHAAQALAAAVRASGRRWRGLIAVSRGGLVPAALLAQRLDLRRIEVACIESYQDQARGVPSLLKTPTLEPDPLGEDWLIVDDLVDSGETLRALKALYPLAQTAVLYAKPAGQDAADYFVHPLDQDIWLVFPWEQQI